MPQLLFEPFRLETLEAEAIKYIRDHEPDGGYQVGFSGGKDSIVTLDLVKRSGVKYAAHCALVAGNDNPSVLRFVREHYPDVKLINAAGPGMNFFKAVEKHGLPAIKVRFCCEMFKETIGTHVIVGIRAEESVARSRRPRTQTFGKRKVKKTIFKPIFRWKEWAVWEYIEKYTLSYPSEYDKGENRLGCVVCPFMLASSKPKAEKLIRSMRNYPLIWKTTKRHAERFFAVHSSGKTTDFEGFWRHWLCNFHDENFERFFPDGVPI